MTKTGKDLKEQYIWEAKSQWNNGLLKDRLRVDIEFFFGDKRKRDLDNFNKIILDALEGVVFENDSQIDHLILARNYDKDNPRAEVKINPIK